MHEGRSHGCRLICADCRSAEDSTTLFEHGENFFVRAGEGELAESCGREPATLARRPPARRGAGVTSVLSRVGDRRCGLRVREFSVPGFQRDAITRDGVFDRAKGFEFFGARVCDPQRIEFSQDMLRLTEPRSDFDVREFPEVGVDDSGRPLAHEKFSIALGDEGEEPALGGGGAFAEVGEFFL